MAVETLGGTITLPFLVLVFRGGNISSEVAVVRLSITRDILGCALLSNYSVITESNVFSNVIFTLLYFYSAVIKYDIP